MGGKKGNTKERGSPQPGMKGPAKKKSPSAGTVREEDRRRPNLEDRQGKRKKRKRGRGSREPLREKVAWP